MALTKEIAVRQIYAAAEWRIRHQLKNAEVMREDLQDELNYFFSKEKVANYELVETGNGFYLGEIKNNKNNGYGAYLWYEYSEPNSLYIGYWENHRKNGEGFFLMSSGVCYHGSFVNDLRQGKQSHLVGKDGIEVVADFYDGEIEKVIYSNDDFTYNGKKYGNNKRNSGSGCLVFIILSALLSSIAICSIIKPNSAKIQHNEMNAGNKECSGRKVGYIIEEQNKDKLYNNIYIWRYSKA